MLQFVQKFFKLPWIRYRKYLITKSSLDFLLITLLFLNNSLINSTNYISKKEISLFFIFWILISYIIGRYSYYRETRKFINEFKKLCKTVSLSFIFIILIFFNNLTDIN